MAGSVRVPVGFPFMGVEMGISGNGVRGRVRDLEPRRGKDDKEQQGEHGGQAPAEGLHARSIASAPPTFKGSANEEGPRLRGGLPTFGVTREPKS